MTEVTTVWKWLPEVSRWECWTEAHVHSHEEWRACASCVIDGPDAAAKWLAQAQKMEPSSEFVLSLKAPTRGPHGEAIVRPLTTREQLRELERETGVRHACNMQREHILEIEERKRARRVTRK